MARSIKKAHAPKKVQSGRYTPPKPRSSKKSPTWHLWMLFGPLILGVLLIVVNFLGVLPGGESTWYLLVGMGLMTVGFVFATKYR